MTKHLKDYAEGWTIFGKVRHMFPHEIAGALINIFDVTFGSRQGRIIHQHFFLPIEMDSGAREILKRYGYHEISLEEHNEERLPEKAPPLGEKSEHLQLIIMRTVGMLESPEAKELSAMEKEKGKVIGYGGGYDTVWKTILLHDRKKLKDLLEFLTAHGLEYKLPEGIEDPLAKKG
ncbi:MAG: hypothetical protein V3S46_00615 [Nitrospinota bacterium]